MVHQDKHAAYLELKGEKHLGKDQALLEKLKPTSRALRNLSNPDKGKIQQEILWDLLDVATKEEILRSRGIMADIDESPTDPPPPPPPEEPTAQEILVALDLDNNPDDKVIKKLIKDLKIEPKNNKKKVRIAALKEAKERLMNPEKDAGRPEYVIPKSKETPDSNPEEGEKKKEDSSSEGTGVPENKVGESGGSGHSESSDPV